MDNRRFSLASGLSRPGMFSPGMFASVSNQPSQTTPSTEAPEDYDEWAQTQGFGNDGYFHRRQWGQHVAQQNEQAINAQAAANRAQLAKDMPRWQQQAKDQPWAWHFDPNKGLQSILAMQPEDRANIPGWEHLTYYQDPVTGQRVSTDDIAAAAGHNNAHPSWASHPSGPVSPVNQSQPITGAAPTMGTPSALTPTYGGMQTDQMRQGYGGIGSDPRQPSGYAPNANFDQPIPGPGQGMVGTGGFKGLSQPPYNLGVNALPVGAAGDMNHMPSPDPAGRYFGAGNIPGFMNQAPSGGYSVGSPGGGMPSADAGYGMGPFPYAMNFGGMGPSPFSFGGGLMNPGGMTTSMGLGQPMFGTGYDPRQASGYAPQTNFAQPIPAPGMGQPATGGFNGLNQPQPPGMDQSQGGIYGGYGGRPSFSLA